MENNNTFKYSEIEMIYGSQYRVAEAVKRGDLYHVGRGIYSKSPDRDSFALIRTKYPHAIITANTAHYLHSLTDTIPETIHLATKRNATRIAESDITQIFVSAELFEPGRTEVAHRGYMLPIYDKERLLVEALRKSSSMPFDYYKEIIAAYRRIADELDYRKIEDYINLYKHGDRLRNALQREVL